MDEEVKAHCYSHQINKDREMRPSTWPIARLARQKSRMIRPGTTLRMLAGGQATGSSC